MYPDKLLVCWAAQPCTQQQQQPKKKKNLTFCFNFQLIICGSCAKLVLLQRDSARQSKTLEIRSVEGGRKASPRRKSIM